MVMRQFLAFARLSFQEDMAYRAEKFIWTVIQFGSLVPIVSLWVLLSRTGVISVSDSQYLTAYYLLILVISRLSGSDLEEELIKEIKDGQISRDLIKPFPYYLSVLAKDSVWRVAYIPYIMPAIIILFFLIPPTQLLFFVPLVLLAYLQRSLISFLIGISAFWVDQAEALTHLKWMFASIASGAMLPLTFFPTWFQNFSQWTPFYHWGFFPSQVVLGRASVSEVLFGLTLSVSWVVVLAVITRYVWQKGLLRYGAVGG